MNPDSPAMQLLTLIFTSTSPRCTRGDRNLTMREGLRLATQVGMRFELDDFWRMAAILKSSSWLCNPERAYSEAVGWGNLSVARSYERWVGRKPFYWQGRRLRVHRQFDWKGKQCEVVAFDDVEGYVIAETVQSMTEFDASRPQCQFKITHAELRRAQRKAKN